MMGDMLMNMVNKFREAREKAGGREVDGEALEAEQAQIIEECEFDYAEHLDVVSELNMAVPDDDTQLMKKWNSRAKKLMKSCEANSAFKSRLQLNHKVSVIVQRG